ncbi:hypothetical protein GUITHDRAFT_86008 [Guillardia theta CCMP2712]|uniref:Intraflagellar transport protein 20 n=1 Tax=Guillardia theta (strain CCMP2712) TaxID=905079 RepID=L1JJ05_GUITC|nr:hypothetical protein GUITHDRAFT_86008 [Guillardia theta CCMP2712]EKX48508.1 hypothetical protein GUITHDRAFT_86008 [Guillardia theta CCMP2712]|eukprot:XP_005835488.1 hypothetical protein GUITHDRAFT_86008 [Guillardia theta CCMP2712]
MAEVFFDGTFRLRVLEEEKYKDTERLAEEATSFTSKMGQFQDTVQKLVEGMNRHASRIESAKLKALGQRNRVESEKESRKIRAAELQSQINEKRAQLERLQQQLASLQKVDKEQRAIIEKLGNNEP